MQIGEISNIASLAKEWTAAQPQSKPADASPSIAAPATEGASISTASVAPSAAPARVENSPASVHVTRVATTLSATVAGKNYAESVEESGGVYVASVPNPPGARATGASVVSAENNLNLRLDTLA